MAEEYVTRFPDGTLVRWKPLSWDEYRRLTKVFGETTEGAAGWLLCEAACGCCLLDYQQSDQSNNDELYAGTVYTVGRQVIELTGFIPSIDNVRKGLAEARARVQSDWFETAMALVCSVFKKDEEEVRGWTFKKFMDYCARIEVVTGRPLPVDDGSEATPQQRFATGPDGRRIPLITKHDMQKRNMTAEDMKVAPGPND